MSDIAIAIHGGAGPDSAYIRKNLTEYMQALEEICKKGYEHLRSRNSMDTVFEVLSQLEDEPLFNAGRGSALNEEGKICMDAAVMDGNDLKTGAVAMINQVRNPSRLVQEILKESNNCFLGSSGAMKLAAELGLPLEPESYFVTEHQVDTFIKTRDKAEFQHQLSQKIHGTTGVVVIDKHGNVASGTSSGGTENCLRGRIGDSCVIGAGIYANNKTCAVSATGSGEFLIRGVVAYDLACYLEYTGQHIEEACRYIIHDRNRDIRGDMGVIAVDKHGRIGMSFNSQRMHRAWIGLDGELHVKIYS